MLLAERGNEKYTVHLTYPIAEIDVERKKEAKKKGKPWHRRNKAWWHFSMRTRTLQKDKDPRRQKTTFDQPARQDVIEATKKYNHRVSHRCFWCFFVACRLLVLVQFEAEAFRVQPLGCCFGQAS